jgi:hypothetical protein
MRRAAHTHRVEVIQPSAMLRNLDEAPHHLHVGGREHAAVSGTAGTHGYSPHHSARGRRSCGANRRGGGFPLRARFPLRPVSRLGHLHAVCELGHQHDLAHDPRGDAVEHLRHEEHVRRPLLRAHELARRCCFVCFRLKPCRAATRRMRRRNRTGIAADGAARRASFKLSFFDHPSRSSSRGSIAQYTCGPAPCAAAQRRARRPSAAQRSAAREKQTSTQPS